MNTSPHTPRVLCNDDAWILGTCRPPITIDDLRDKMVGPYQGSAIDTFLWSVGGHEVFDYETEIGERFGQDPDALTDDRQKTQAANLRSLIAEHGGPVTVIAQLCREAGVKFFASLRMNEHYDMETASPNYGRFRRDHPELLIGRPDDDLAEGSLHHGIRTGKDYAHPEVRAFMSRIVLELVERFDVDGIELDYFRHPAHFRPDEAYANRSLMTEMIGHLRRQIDEIGHQKGRHIEIAVRVPGTVADSARIGLDIEAWIKQGLADIVIAGGGFIPFETRIDEFVAAAEGTPCQVLGCFEALRPLLEPEVMRAIAARYWDQGASGIYFFNYYNMSAEWKRDFVGDLADPAKLSRLSKRYDVDARPVENPTTQLGWSFRNAIPSAQLPVRLERAPADQAVMLRIDIVDDLAAARADGVISACTLGLGFNQLCAGDVVDVTLNDEAIDWVSRTAPSPEWTRTVYSPDWGLGQYESRTIEEPVDGDAVEFDITHARLQQGRNVLAVRLAARDATVTEPLILKEVRVVIDYRTD